MNSLQLIQRTCSHWLTVHEASALPARSTELLLSAVNAGVQAVWSLLPADYRERNNLAFAFAAAESGTMSVTAGSVTIPAVTSSLIGCSIRFSDDPITNEIASTTSLRHPYGGTTGAKSYTLFHDALMLSYNLVRLTSDFHCLEFRRPFTFYQKPPKNEGWLAESFWIERPIISGVRKTVIRLRPESDLALRFEASGIITPADLSMVSANVAEELPYPQNVGDMIALAAGQWLATHPQLKPEMKEEAQRAVQLVQAQVSLLSPAVTSEFNSIGPPLGW